MEKDNDDVLDSIEEAEKNNIVKEFLAMMLKLLEEEEDAG